MASWLKKIKSKQSIKRKPSVRAAVSLNNVNRTEKIIKTTADEFYEWSEAFSSCIESISNMFALYLLAGFFKVPVEKAVKFKECFDRKRDAVLEGRTSHDELIRHEIKGVYRRDYPIGWKDYEAKRLPESKINMQARPSRSDVDTAINTRYMLGKDYAHKIFCTSEVLYITALHDSLGWMQWKCQMFCFLYRSLWDCTPKDVYDIHELICRRDGYIDGGQVKHLRRTQKLWQLGFTRV